MGLNPQQIEAINHQDGPCLCKSCPGSGKTTVLVERTARLINSGIRPEDIISLTFTNKAGKEMKERILKKLNTQRLKTYMGTFHSFCALMLRRYAHHRGYTNNYSIMDESDQRSFIKKVSKDMFPEDADRINPFNISMAVNTVRENLENIESGLAAHFAKKTSISSDDTTMHVAVSMAYLKSIRENNLIDFSGLLYEAIKVMEENEFVRSFMQNCHKYLQVDEGQDTNLAQFRFVELLADKHRNIFVVADPDQSIYAFRGSRMQNIRDFIKKYDAKVLELSWNYRSTPQIVKAADTLICKNTSHMSKEFKTQNPEGDPVKVVVFDTPQVEAESVASQIASWLMNEKHKASDIVVLYRINALSRILEESFRKRSIPYKIVGGMSFYDRMEVKDSVAMLKLLVNPSDSVAFARLANILPGMGEKTISVIEEEARKDKQGFVKACGAVIQSVPKMARQSCQQVVDVYGKDYTGMNAGQVMELLLDGFHYDAHLSKTDQAKYHERLDNLEEMRLSAMSNGNAGLTVGEYLQGIMLLSSADDDKVGPCVTLMTIHAAKGLEFPVVFIVGVETGMIPHARSVDEPGGVEEERRLMYVAMTRAKRKLFISYCKLRERAFGKNKRMERVMPSVFLKEAGLLASGGCEDED